MDMTNIAHTVAKFAPLLGSALAGPGGAIIGGLVASAFGGDMNQPDALQELITSDPAAALKLKQIELDHQLELQRLLIQTAQSEIATQCADNDSARQREVAVDTIPLAHRDRTPAMLAYLLTIGLFVALASLFYLPIPENNQEVILGIVTSLTTVWISAMGYYHGSSSGSRLKDLGMMQHLQGILESK